MKRWLLASLMLLASLGAAAADNPFNGTWKSVHEGSYWSDGKFPKNFSLTINLKFEGDKLVYYSQNDSDKTKPPRVLKFNAHYDNKPYPLTGSDRYNQVTLRRLRDNAFELLQLKDGDVIVGATWELLPDGRLVRWGVAKSPEGVSKSYLEYFVRK